MPAGRKPAGWAGRGLRKEVQLEGRSSAVGGGARPWGAEAQRRRGPTRRPGRRAPWNRSWVCMNCCTSFPSWRLATCCAPPKWTRSGMRLQGPRNCGASQMTLGTQTWKQYYLRRSELEFRMASGRPEDFTCRALAGHKGEIDDLAYISTSEYRFDGQDKSVVCTVSSDGTVRAWDLHEGMELWSSPVQSAALVNLVAYPRLQLVVTVDERGLIKVWEAENGCEKAAFLLPMYSSALEACDIPEGPLLLAACAEGALYTLTVPWLQLLSRVNVFPGNPTSLLCSPDRQWVFASTQNSDLSPEVFYTQSLLCRSEDETPASTTLPIWLTSRACWTPDEAARLMVMHRNDNGMQLVITTYELGSRKSRDRVEVLVRQIASFLLPDTMMPPHLMKGHGSQVILLVSGSELVLFTIHGLQLVAFQDHQRPITSMWVDQTRVITSSFDLSLRVYLWNKENKFPVLKSCYHLLGGSHRWASTVLLLLLSHFSRVRLCATP
ncbi:F-box/WD repeat-containing protein 12 isoform X3 [Bos taurus]|uniref:F-box/WD repeat-containing protein 12 isoform X3 n=1 Tax=Bos taurus TaxID=9913 RepID=UPI0028CB9606|nr:F-box/WD repeat-containing protein 12 isoform X3 [Bos taurus]